jgi:hypothetical protein
MTNTARTNEMLHLTGQSNWRPASCPKAQAIKAKLVELQMEFKTLDHWQVEPYENEDYVYVGLLSDRGDVMSEVHSLDVEWDEDKETVVVFGADWLRKYNQVHDTYTEIEWREYLLDEQEVYDQDAWSDACLQIREEISVLRKQNLGFITELEELGGER